MSHHQHKPEGYEARLAEYMNEHLHPETAKIIGDMVLRSPLGSSEFAMGIVVQMQLDPTRKDDDIVHQGEPGHNVVPIRPLNWDGVVPKRR